MKKFKMLLLSGVVLGFLVGAACGSSDQELKKQLVDTRAKLEMKTEIIRQNNDRFLEFEGEKKRLLAQLKTQKSKVTATQDSGGELQRIRRELAEKNKLLVKAMGENRQLLSDIASRDKKIASLQATTPAGQQAELISALREQVVAAKNVSEERRRRLISLGHQAKRIHNQAKRGTIDTKRTRYMYRYAASTGRRVQHAKDQLLRADTRVQHLAEGQSAHQVAIAIAVNETALKRERAKKMGWYHKAMACKRELKKLASGDAVKGSNSTPSKKLENENEKLRTENEKLQQK
ncbi:MAG: hypothetical protein ABII02_02640, partial [Candidatus Magasanikbacteria bacterium]